MVLIGVGTQAVSGPHLMTEVCFDEPRDDTVDPDVFWC